MLPLVIIALLTIAVAAIAMTLRNLIHSALLLIGSWAGIAAFYFWAGAEFAAFAQVLVYVGAVSMVVLFAVLLTRRSRADLEVAPDAIGRGLGAMLAGGAVLGVLFGAVFATRLDVAPTAAPTASVRAIGQQLMGAHAASLLVVGVILTVALLGAVVIASTDREGGKEDAR
ncbi:MAG: NADH-quinone oxidoreductase subunit J [Verrucomicrobia bacterium]|nr:NADH-quinone oxidoreductase subunit J [Verrucomicrobiota bacterium]